MKYITESGGVAAILPELMRFPSWGVDTETTGLDAHKDKVVLLQIGRQEEQFVIDTRTASIEPLRPFLENVNVLKVGHNLKFDYKMLKGTSQIELEGIRDTLIGEKVLTAGKKKRGFRLEDVLLERLGIVADKTLQKSFIGHKGAFTKEQLQYAADDVVHMIPLCKKMLDEMRPAGLIPTFQLECDVVSSFGDMEFDGMLIDVPAWQALIEKHTGLAVVAKSELDVFASPFVGVNLFDEVDMNYGSPSQVVTLLRMMKVKIKEGDSYLPVTKTDKKTLKKLRDLPFIQALQKWRSLQKRINTYGQPFIDAINPLTGRIHPNLWQMGTDTGRPAAGESDVNPLNIPRENAFRHCFICYPDEVMESDDYSGCESRILAEISGDKKLTGIFQRGEDIHCAVATDLYGVEVTKKGENSRLRTPAKNLNFG
jgi:DNA polymerase-1